MSSTSVQEFSQTRENSWFQLAYTRLQAIAAPQVLVGLVSGALMLLLLLLLPEPWNLRLPLYLIVLIWIILRPRVALYLLPIAVPWGSLDFIDVGSLRLNSADLLVVFLTLGWLLSFTLPPIKFRGTNPKSASFSAGPADREASSPVPHYLVFAMLALLGIMLLSITVAISISSSLKELSKWLELVILVMLGTQYIRTRTQIWTIIVLIVLGGISQAILGYYQAFFNLGPANFIRDASLRVYGTFDQPNPFAGYINIPLSITLALMLLGSTWRTRILAGLATVLLFLVMYLTQSKGGYLAIGAALLFIIGMGFPRFRPVFGLLTIAVLGFIAGTLAGLIPSSILSPILRILGLTGISFTAPTPQDYATAERLAHWIAGLRMFFDHPFLGVGIGNFPDAYSQYFVTIFVNSLGHAHNYYINIAAETGFIGLVIYLIFLTAIFVAGGRSYRNINRQYLSMNAARNQQVAVGLRNKLQRLVDAFSLDRIREKTLPLRKNDRALAIGLLAALLAICVHNFVDDLYVHSVTNLIALLIIALIRLERVPINVGSNYGG